MHPTFLSRSFVFFLLSRKIEIGQWRFSCRSFKRVKWKATIINIILTNNHRRLTSHAVTRQSKQLPFPVSFENVATFVSFLELRSPWTCEKQFACSILDNYISVSDTCHVSPFPFYSFTIDHVRGHVLGQKLSRDIESTCSKSICHRYRDSNDKASRYNFKLIVLFSFFFFSSIPRTSERDFALAMLFSLYSYSIILERAKSAGVAFDRFDGKIERRLDERACEFRTSRPLR